MKIKILQYIDTNTVTVTGNGSKTSSRGEIRFYPQQHFVIFPIVFKNFLLNRSLNLKSMAHVHFIKINATWIICNTLGAFSHMCYRFIIIDNRIFKLFRKSCLFYWQVLFFFSDSLSSTFSVQKFRRLSGIF